MKKYLQYLFVLLGDRRLEVRRHGAGQIVSMGLHTGLCYGNWSDHIPSPIFV